MATVKISELPAASSVGSADLIPVVQGGVTKQATFANLGPLRQLWLRDYGAVPYATQAAALAGTDSTEAFIDASDAAIAAGGGTVVIDPGFYRISGALQTTRTGNAQIPLPVVAYDGPKVSLRWDCHEPAAAEIYPAGANSTSNAGAILVSTLTGQTYSATYGSPSVIGGPTPEGCGQAQGLGVPMSDFSNIYFESHGVAVRNQPNPTLTAWDLGGIIACNMIDGRADTTTLGSTVTTAPSNPWAFGIIMPRSNNNVLNRVGNFTVTGHYVGLSFGEHALVDNVQLLWCTVALSPSGCDGHANLLRSVSIEQCPTCIAFVYPRYGVDGSAAARAGGVGSGPLSTYTIEFLDVENVVGAGGGWASPAYHLWDPYSSHRGTIYYSFSGSGGHTAPFVRRGGEYVDAIDKRTGIKSKPVALAKAYTELDVANGTISTPANAAILIPYVVNGVTYQIPGYVAAPVTLLSHTWTAGDSASSNPAADTGQTMVAVGTSTWGVASNKGYCSAASAQYTGLVADVSRADCTVSVDITLGATRSDCGLMLRATDASNFVMIWLQVSGSLNQFAVYRKVAGNFDGMANPVTGLGLTLGSTINLKAVMAESTIKIYVDTVLKQTIVFATEFDANTKHGIMCNFTDDTNGSSRFDNLLITT